MTDLDSKNKLSIIYKALDSKKAEDIVMIDITKLTPVADYFIIASCTNESQLLACVEEVERKLRDSGVNTPKSEGRRGSGWILLDCLDVIVHIFLTNEREFYDIERIWADGNKVFPDELSEE